MIGQAAAAMSGYAQQLSAQKAAEQYRQQAESQHMQNGAVDLVCIDGVWQVPRQVEGDGT